MSDCMCIVLVLPVNVVVFNSPSLDLKREGVLCDTPVVFLLLDLSRQKLVEPPVVSSL